MRREIACRLALIVPSGTAKAGSNGPCRVPTFLSLSLLAPESRKTYNRHIRNEPAAEAKVIFRRVWRMLPVRAKMARCWGAWADANRGCA